ncbi:MAG: hypothetical protein ACO38U_09400, partial [Burkholderiaceae bacterium]
MGLASTKPTDKGELAVFGVIAKGDLMRQKGLPDAGQGFLSRRASELSCWRFKEIAARCISQQAHKSKP